MPICTRILVCIRTVDANSVNPLRDDIVRGKQAQQVPCWQKRLTSNKAPLGKIRTTTKSKQCAFSEAVPVRDKQAFLHGKASSADGCPLSLVDDGNTL
jgi:hypothetical protein